MFVDDDVHVVHCFSQRSLDIMAFVIVTINRSKNVVRSSEAENFKGALEIVARNKAAAEAANWKTFVSGTYEYPIYVTRKHRNLAGTHVTSFSMINGKKADGGEYYFTYIKKAA